MDYNKMGFIGCGNMGSAIAACVKNGISKRKDAALFFSNRTEKKADVLAGKLGGKSVSNADIAENCDLIFIGVKPQMLGELFSQIRPILQKRSDPFTLVSMAAGVTVERIKQLAGGDFPTIRIMPNTAIAVSKGVIQYCCNGVSDSEKSEFVELISSAGLIDELNESLMDAASSVSGCGPAFLCLVLEGMADGGVAVGLPRAKALMYAAQTIVGLGELAIESGKHPGTLKDEVTSPAGTTIQGVRALENASVRAAFMEAVIAAYEKTLDLKKNI